MLVQWEPATLQSPRHLTHVSGVYFAMQNDLQLKKTAVEYGKEREDAAYLWCIENGFKVLNRNYRSRVGEIDLIAEEYVEEECTLVFFEVKARKNGQNGFEAVNFRKQIRVESVSKKFLQTYRGEASGIRFDVLFWNGESWKHMRGAW